jgi:Tol biopolymer transport system component
MTLLHYRLVDKLGEGGMGAVWRATDTTLDREVALKVLPEAVADDEERRARFEREARLLASLNHPNIATLYGLEHVDGGHVLAMELVDGEDLAARIRRGPMPMDEALRVALQIADGLEAAHERGVVHRDLKPANVMIGRDGTAKVLDFGLATAWESAGSDVDLTRSPTLTARMTQAGVLLGTAAYMSPEQARGASVDRRADIWAFGCVLLELLTGNNPFREDTVSDTVASILRSEPDWQALPADVPPALRRLLQRCLDKDPRRRLRDIGEARVAIDGVLSGEIGDEESAAPVPEPATRSRRWMWVTAAVVVVMAAVTTVVVRTLLPSPEKPAARRFVAITGAFQAGEDTAPAVSPDGRKIVFVRNGHLWIRRLDQLEPQQLEGTEAALMPAWMPDSQSIVFSSKGDLKVVPFGGGATTTVGLGVGNVAAAGGISCGPGGRIIFSSGGGGIVEISVRGGDSHDVLLPDGEREADLHQPSFIPDGSILFVAHRVPEGPDTIAVLAGGSRKNLLQLDTQSLANPVYSPTGHIIFRRDRPRAGLWAVPFELGRLEVTGEPFLITQDGDQPSVANDGTLLYVSGAVSSLRQLVWVGRDGVIGEAMGQPQTGIAAPALSPDGSRVAIMGTEGDIGNIWVYDIARKTRTRLTFGNATDWDPAWTSDGTHVVFWDGTTRALSVKAADGTGEVVRLIEQNLVDSGVPSISNDGKWMVFWVKPTVQQEDIWYMALDGDRTPVPFVASEFVEDTPRISPDGTVLAYASEESGRREVYLTRFPSGEGKWQVSIDGGAFPVWSPVGGELFYLDGSMVKQVDVVTEPSVQLGTPRTLFDAAELGLDVLGHTRFEVSRDGRRFVMVKQLREQNVPPSLVLSYEWIARFREPD